MQPCNTKTIVKKLENIRKLFESNFGSENLKKLLKCKYICIILILNKKFNGLKYKMKSNFFIKNCLTNTKKNNF